jgi:hypothetical protein
MLNGLSPILIFQFSKKLVDLSAVGDVIAKIPLIAEIPSVVDEPPIPVYLSETITGVFIESEDKSVDVVTDFETKTDGSPVNVNQKGASSVVSINLLARKDSLGVALLSALIDLAFDKVTSNEYSVSYLSGPTTVFRGKITQWVANQNADNELLSMKLEITRGEKQPEKVEPQLQVDRLTDGQALDPQAFNVGSA